jgi:hypothetical protein
MANSFHMADSFHTYAVRRPSSEASKKSCDSCRFQVTSCSPRRYSWASSGVSTTRSLYFKSAIEKKGGSERISVWHRWHVHFYNSERNKEIDSYFFFPHPPVILSPRTRSQYSSMLLSSQSMARTMPSDHSCSRPYLVRVWKNRWQFFFFFFFFFFFCVLLGQVNRISDFFPPEHLQLCKL